MSSYGKAFSNRLFIQAAFTGLLAPLAAGSTWLVISFALAAGSLAAGFVTRNGHAQSREIIVGFEVIAVAVGVVGIVGHHYIPGTIVGVATLITAFNNAPSGTSPAAAEVAAPPAPAPAPAPGPYVPDPRFGLSPAPAAAPFATVVAAAPVAEPPAPSADPYATPVYPAPAYAAPVVPPPMATPVEAAVPVEAPAEAPPAPPAVRSMNILPGG